MSLSLFLAIGGDQMRSGRWWVLASKWAWPREELLGCCWDRSQEGLQRKWFSFGLLRATKILGKQDAVGR